MGHSSLSPAIEGILVLSGRLHQVPLKNLSNSFIHLLIHSFIQETFGALPYSVHQVLAIAFILAVVRAE